MLMAQKAKKEKFESFEEEKTVGGLGKIARKILFELDRDSFQTLSEIGEKVKKSPQYVDYWINKLIQEGYVKKFVTIIDYKKFGYSYYTIYLSFKTMPAEKEQKFIDFLSTDKSITFLYVCHGRWNVIAGLLAKDPVDVYEKLLDIKQNFGDALGEIIVESHVGSKFLGRKHLSDTEVTLSSIPLTGGRAELIDFDKKDIKILSVIKDNARASIIQLAELSGLSPDVVRYRLKQLKSKGVILRASFLPDYSKIKWKPYRLLLKLRATTLKKEGELLSFFEVNPYAFRLTREFGNYDLSVDIEIPSGASIHDLIRDLKSRFYDIIAGYELIEVAKIERSYYFLSV